MKNITSEIERLTVLALTGNETAIRQIFEAGAHISEAIRNTWFEKPLPYNPFARHDVDCRLIARRQALRKVVEDMGYIPTVTMIPWSAITWDYKAGRTRQLSVPDKSYIQEQQSELLGALRTPKISGRGRLGMLRWILSVMIIPRVRTEPTLAKLPPLTKATATKWAAAITKLAWEKQGEAIRTKGTDWNFMAGGGKKKLRGKLKRKAQTTGRITHQLARAGEDSEKIAFKKSNRAAYAALQTASDADLRDGLYQGFFRALSPLPRT